ncbi:Deoxyribonuclease NucA/NucB domain containing protein [Rhypophila decipiens]
MLPHVTAVVLSFLAATATAASYNFEWDCTKSLGTCNNACFAIYTKKYKDTLTYDSDVKIRDQRRIQSGCSRNPCNDAKLSYGKFGKSCDEFPFASTKEGGAGAYLRCVDGPENSSEGGQLGNFYKKMKNGDTFKLFIRNYKGARFCDSPGAANDGGQFTFKNSQFVNSKLKMARRALGFETVEDDLETSPITVGETLREYEDSEGGRVLALSLGEQSMVGQLISDGNRTLTIMKEVPRL